MNPWLREGLRDRDRDRDRDRHRDRDPRGLDATTQHVVVEARWGRLSGRGTCDRRGDLNPGSAALPRREA